MLEIFSTIRFSVESKLGMELDRQVNFSQTAIF